MAYIPPNVNGQATSANSAPVVLASNQATSISDVVGGIGLGTAIMATNFVTGTANSSTVQLAASATFTGTIESIFNQQAISMLLTSDQSGTLTLNQYIDAAGLRKAAVATFLITAGTGFSRSLVANGNYFNLTFQNTGASTTTTLNINTFYGTIPASTNRGNLPISLDEVNGTALALGQTTMAASIPVTLASNQIVSTASSAASATYAASINGLAPATTATDIFTITGSNTKTIRITKVDVNGIQTTAGQVAVVLIKRSTANTAGTSTAQTAVTYDSSNTSATAVVLAYTANPTTGTLVGRFYSQRVFMPGAATASDAQGLSSVYGDIGQQNIVLRGINEVFAVNFNGVTVVGGSANVTIEWTES
jgi:hypothetical protein